MKMFADDRAPPPGMAATRRALMTLQRLLCRNQHRLRRISPYNFAPGCSLCSLIRFLAVRTHLQNRSRGLIDIAHSKRSAQTSNTFASRHRRVACTDTCDPCAGHAADRWPRFAPSWRASQNQFSRVDVKHSIDGRAVLLVKPPRQPSSRTNRDKSAGGNAVSIGCARRPCEK